MNTRLLPSLTLLLALAPAALMAQGRFEPIDRPYAVPAGLTAEQSARFAAKVRRIRDMLASLAPVHTPPAGMCTRLTSGVDAALRQDSLMTQPMASGGASVALPARYAPSGCSELTNNGIGVVLNAPAAIVPNSERVEAEHTAFFGLPPVAWQKPGIIAFTDGKIAITRPGVSFFVPVTKAEYLTEVVRQHRLQAEEQGGMDVADYSGDSAWQQWITTEKPAMIAENQATLASLEGVMSPAELATMRQTLDEVVKSAEAGIRAMAAQDGELAKELSRADSVVQQELTQAEAALAALTPAQRALPACVDHSDPRSAGSDHCEHGGQIFKMNPQLFAGARPDEVRLVFVSPGTGLHKLNLESQAFFDLRMAIYRAVDTELLAGLID